MSMSRYCLIILGCGLLAGCAATTSQNKDKSDNLVISLPVAPADADNHEFASGLTSIKYADMDTVADYMSDGSVQIYSLDGPPGPLPVPTDRQNWQNTRSPMVDGVQAGQDPNVTIYPFQEARVESLGLPEIMPPASVQPEFLSPFSMDGKVKAQEKQPAKKAVRPKAERGAEGSREE